MLIKKRNNHYLKLLSIIFNKLNSKKRIFTALFIIFILFLYPVLILEIDKVHPTYQKGKIVIINNFQILKNYTQSFEQKTETIHLDIKDLDFKKLEYIKKLSYEHYLGLDNLDKVSLMRKEWVPASLRYKNNEYQIDIRVKGQSVDHWGKYGSYKIKIKKDKTLFGMKRFALQHPKTRAFLNEWYYHKFLEFNDLISLRYKFLRVIVNGEKFPIFALEENFDKRLLENNSKKEGIIFRINLNLEEPVQFQQSDKDILSNEFLLTQSQIVKKNIKLFFDNKLLASDIFDIPSLAKFYAIKDLWGNRHAGQIKNMRFYYNQLTSLIEPIGYDQQAVYPTQLLGIIGNNKKINVPSGNIDFFNYLFKDKTFYSEYIKSLKLISSKTHLDEFFEKVKSDSDKQIKILYKSYPYFQLKSKYQPLLWPYQDKNNLSYRDSLWLPSNNNILYENQNYIRSILNLDHNSLNLIKTNKMDENKIEIEFLSNKNLPIKLNNIFINNLNVEYKDDFIIQGNTSKKLKLDANLINNFTEISKIKIGYSLIGANEIYEKEINLLNNFNSVNKIKNNIKDLSQFSFLEINYNKKIITIKDGDHIINTAIIIPPNYIVKINPGTKILLKDNGKIISYSPINFAGSENNNIQFFSDTNSQGLSIINAKGISNINYVKFSNLSNIEHAGIINTGSVNFYNSDVNIQNTIIENSNAEDSINIIHSKFNIDNLKIFNSKSDAIDLDFSNGIIKNSIFKDNGNDGIDISAGRVFLENVYIDTSGDKGISIGENSFVNLTFADIKNSYIGLAVKDQSSLKIDDDGNQNLTKGLKIKNSKYGIALYQKKSEFGPAEVHIGNSGDHYLNLNFDNVFDQFIVEKNSYLRIGPLNNTDYTNNVFKTLYPQ